MAKQLAYNSAESMQADEIPDPYLRPAFSLSNRLKRLVWNIVWLVLYRTSPRPFHAWRTLLLRLFGATMGPDCHFYPRSRIWAPWNLYCADQVAVADGVEIYNVAPIRFGSHVILSQSAYICGATHDYNDPAFPLLAYEMTFGPYAWICARASVGPGVHVGEGAVLGLASVTTRSLEPWTIYAGNPAVRIKERRRTMGDPDISVTEATS
ncbi:MAG: putative colanic acid biosynthesis acetyltransferase [Acidobacteria bacterium]|nr:putative colanic acid biosynthesis acetyltransferase [Acidobacteriota bacterium]